MRKSRAAAQQLRTAGLGCSIHTGSAGPPETSPEFYENYTPAFGDDPGSNLKGVHLFGSSDAQARHTFYDQENELLTILSDDTLFHHSERFKSS